MNTLQRPECQRRIKAVAETITAQLVVKRDIPRAALDRVLQYLDKVAFKQARTTKHIRLDVVAVRQWLDGLDNPRDTLLGESAPQTNLDAG
jgi:hypothetical protein